MARSLLLAVALLALFFSSSLLAAAQNINSSNNNNEPALREWARGKDCDELFVAQMSPGNNGTSAANGGGTIAASESNSSAFVCLRDDDWDDYDKDDDDEDKFPLLWSVKICDQRNPTGVKMLGRQAEVSVDPPSTAAAARTSRIENEAGCRVVDGALAREERPAAWRSFLADLRGERLSVVVNTEEDGELSGVFERVYRN
jgi:hypothetical protein